MVTVSSFYLLAQIRNELPIFVNDSVTGLRRPQELYNLSLIQPAGSTQPPWLGSSLLPGIEVSKKDQYNSEQVHTISVSFRGTEKEEIWLRTPYAHQQSFVAVTPSRGEHIHIAYTVCTKKVYAEQGTHSFKSLWHVARKEDRRYTLHILWDRAPEVRDTFFNVVEEKLLGDLKDWWIEVVWVPEQRLPTQYDLFGRCSCQRLLFETHPHHSQLDAFIYVDLDTEWVSDPGYFWDEFACMGEKQSIALAREAHQYPSYYTKRITNNRCTEALCRHFLEPHGHNAGVALMNITKMKRDKLSRKFMRAMKVFGDSRKYFAMTKVPPLDRNRGKSPFVSDQDVITHVLYFHPEMLHELTCEWNARMSSGCSFKGVGILHRNHKIFAVNRVTPKYSNRSSQLALGDGLDRQFFDQYFEEVNQADWGLGATRSFIAPPFSVATRGCYNI